MQGIARAFAMDPATWERHASPWSVWTRVPILPVGVAILLCRDALGGWIWPLLMLLAAWTWINPRAFAPPVSTRSWASRAVMGERVWLARAETPIPDHHAAWARILVFAPLAGLLPLVWGVWAVDAALALSGTVIVIGAKLWFLDRMVWLFDDMAARHAEYRAWLR